MAGTTAAVSVLEARWASLMPDAAAAQPPDDAPSPSPSPLAGPGSVGTWHGGLGHLSLVVEVPGPGEGWAPWRVPLPRVPGISSRVRAAQVLSERAAAPGALGLMSAQEKLEVVQAAEVVKAHLDAVAAEAAASMFADIRETVTGGEVNESDLPVSARDRLVAQARSLTVEEIQAATGWGSGQCWRQVSFAPAPAARSGFAKARLREGACSFERAQVVVERTAGLPADIAEQIAAEVLGVRPDGAPWSAQQFTNRLYRRVKTHQDVSAAKEEFERALTDRGAWARLFEDGTGSLTFTGAGEVVAAAMARVDLLARRFKRAGDQRTLSQLRADIAADLIMRGVIPAPDTTNDTTTASGDGNGPSASGDGNGPSASGDGNGPTASGDGNGPSISGDADRTAEAEAWAAGTSLAAEVAARWAGYQQVGQPPAAQVDLIVALSTLLGLDEGVGVIRGQGPVTAWQARRIAMAQGSVWARIVTDPLTGRAVERSINRYAPDAVMREQCEVRDGVCRFPGCTVPAHLCQKDHEEEYRADAGGTSVGGPTSELNLFNKDPQHHSRKTRGYWTSSIQEGTGRMVWSSLLGRSYATDPMDYHDLTGTNPAQPAQPTPGHDPVSLDWTAREGAEASSDGAGTGSDGAGTGAGPPGGQGFDAPAWDRAEKRAAGRSFAYQDDETIDLGLASVRADRDRARRSQRDCHRCRDLGHACLYHQQLAPTGRAITEDTTPPIKT